MTPPWVGRGNPMGSLGRTTFTLGSSWNKKNQNHQKIKHQKQSKHRFALKFQKFNPIRSMPWVMRLKKGFRETSQVSRDRIVGFRRLGMGSHAPVVALQPTNLDLDPHLPGKRHVKMTRPHVSFASSNPWRQ
jgi:hypothetical protein